MLYKAFSLCVQQRLRPLQYTNKQIMEPILALLLRFVPKEREKATACFNSQIVYPSTRVRWQESEDQHRSSSPVARSTVFAAR
jgi:hypothetical protein